MPAETRQNA